MDASLYQPLFLTLTIIACLVVSVRYLSSPGYTLQEQSYERILLPLAISLLLVLWIGNRPISGRYFGDTANYALMYANKSISFVSFNWRSEWIWQWLMLSCKAMGMSVSGFFTIVEAGYVLTVLWAVKILMPSKPMLGMLFVFASLSYFTFGVNGLRNGLACHIVLLAMAYLLDGKYVPGIAWGLVAFGIHRSTLLPMAAICAGMFLIKSPKYAIYLWLASIPISLVAGTAVTSFFSSLGFDDRMAAYANVQNDMSGFSRTGFRWDFLLYSAMPIWMAWYVCVKRQIEDNWYRVICVAYCLSNAFWVMVIRSSFSNRFAYLSWFLYPVMITYPLVNMPIWEDQDKKTGQILLAYCGFTAFMQLIYW